MGKFNITFLGVGSAFSKIHYNNNILIDINGDKYLLDCGITAPKALHEMNIELKDIKGIIISHIHADHVGGLEEVGFMSKFVFKKKIDLYVPDTLIDDLWNKCLSGGMEDLENGKATIEDYFNIHIIEDITSFLISNLEITPIKTIHVPNNDENKIKSSYSFLIDNRVFYTADIVFMPNLINAISSEVEIIFHDCQLEKHSGVHASLEELETLNDDIKKKINIMHYGDNFKNFDNRIMKSGMRRVLQGQAFEF